MDAGIGLTDYYCGMLFSWSEWLVRDCAWATFLVAEPLRAASGWLKGDCIKLFDWFRLKPLAIELFMLGFCEPAMGF